MHFDYGLILVLASLITGLIWLFDVIFLKPKRKLALENARKNGAKLSEQQTEKIMREPVLVDYSHSFFPILIIILVLRSFLYEPFRIPSGSMKPTLLVGDFILVNKYAYGVRLPVTHSKILETGAPQRGDVAVFRYPDDPRDDYIKRVVGLPGETVYYIDKTIYIKPACKEEQQVKNECPERFRIDKDLSSAAGFDDDGLQADVYRELLGEKTHSLLVHPQIRLANDPRARRFIEELRRGVHVPEGHYFMIGDNRDRSNDSRFWGTVPEENLVGKAVAVWMHLDFGIENKFFGWIPTGVDFGRIGSIE